MNEPDGGDGGAIIGQETKWVEARSLCQASAGRYRRRTILRCPVPTDGAWGDPHGSEGSAHTSAQFSKAPAQAPPSLDWALPHARDFPRAEQAMATRLPDTLAGIGTWRNDHIARHSSLDECTGNRPRLRLGETR